MYTELNKERDKNKKNGLDAPKIPDFALKESNKSVSKDEGNFKEKVMDFINEMCVDLRFDDKKDNFEKDIDRLCLAKAVKDFFDTPSTENAYIIYFIYIEMFLGNYRDTKNMIEMLSEFESSASTLLMKHRDHYSHSVNVFLIGLAIYDSSEIFRDAYRKMYENDVDLSKIKDKNDKDFANHFLKYWGLTALFHDIGYPFELPFEQIKSYFEKGKDKDKDKAFNPYLCYKNMGSYIEVKGDDIDKAEKLLNKEQREKYKHKYYTDYLITRIVEVFEECYKDRPQVISYTLNNITNNCKYKNDFYNYIKDAIRNKPEDPAMFGGYMDHAYFSANILMKNILNIDSIELNPTYTDAFVAILLHNSIFKHLIQNQKCEDKEKVFEKEKHSLKLNYHPLSYLLMLCDELQCWGRKSYGKTSKLELHSSNSILNFDENKITITYLFDDKYKELKEEIDKQLKDNTKNVKYGGTYKKLVNKNEFLSDNKNEFLSDNKNEFLSDIEDIISLNVKGTLSLVVNDPKFEKIKLNSSNSLSEFNFMNMYDIAERNYANKGIKFEENSLEDKVIALDGARKLPEILEEEFGYFFVDKDLGGKKFEKIESVDKLEEAYITPAHFGFLELDRRAKFKLDMGWQFGKTKDTRLRYIAEKLIGDADEFTELEQEKREVYIAPLRESVKDLINNENLIIYRWKENNENE